MSNEALFSDHYHVNARINYKNTEQENGEEEFETNSEKSSLNFDRLNFFSEKIDWKKIKEELKKLN